MSKPETAKNKKGLLRELERLAAAAEANDYTFSLHTDGLSGEDAEAILFLKKALKKYRSAIEDNTTRYKELNENLLLILDSMSVGIRIVRLEDGELVYANKASMTIFGCEDFERDVAGKSAFDFMPEVQPNGKKTVDLAQEFFELDRVPLDFQCFRLNGELFTARITSCNINYKGKQSSLAIIEDVTEQRKTEEQNKRRELMMDMLNDASVTLIARNEDTIEENMTAGINPIADTADIDRLSVWLNFDKADGLYASMIYRWDRASGGTTKPNAAFVDVAYAEFSPNWEKTFKGNKTVNGPARLMPSREAAVLKANGVISVFVVPVFIENIFVGFVLFEDRKNDRYFDKDCADMLRYAAFLLVNAVMRAEMERKMTEADRRTKLMLDTSPICCQLWDKDFNNIDCNEAAVRLYGFKDKQEYLDRFFETLPEFQPDGKRSDEMAKELLTKTLEEGSCIFNCMHTIPRDGSPMPAEISLFRVNYKGEHTVIGYTRDLREQNKMMADIEYRDALLQAVNSAAKFLLNSDMESFHSDLYESMRALAEAVRVDRVCVWKNYTKDGELYCTQLHEFTEDKQLRTALMIDVPYDKIIPGWKKLLSKGKCVNNIVSKMPPLIQAQLIPRRVASILVVPVFIDEDFWGFVGYDDCRTERIFTETEESLMRAGGLLIANALIRNKMFINLRGTTAQLKAALDAANEANRIKSVFLANMSHEIRTPMNSIMGFAELARDDDISEKSRDYLTKISKNAEWMLHIINDILDISKIESGKIVLESIPFDVHDIYEHCKALIMPNVEEKGLALYCYAEPSVGKKLLGDPIRLRQIITNLLANAVKFTNSGTVKLLASIVSVDEDHATVHFEVKDSGIGMSPDQVERVFEPFVQADSDITRKYSGTGLGLTIAKNLVELMGGTLEVVSAIGVGSKFSFELPFSLIDMPRSSKSEVIVAGQLEKPVFKAEVLICEDNDMNQQVICDHLHRIGIKTAMARNGQEGVDLVAERLRTDKKPFDLIFMDIHMPIMDGLEAALKISKMKVKTPIVALTANVMVNDLEMYRTSGMDSYLGKPFSSQDLYRCLMKYFTPLNYTPADVDRQRKEDEKLLEFLKREFVKNNQTIYEDIRRAVNTGNIQLAYRLAHTLKSNAGNIDETKLQEAAAVAEAMLRGKKTLLKDRHMDKLGVELNAVLEKYAHLLPKEHAAKPIKNVDKAKTRKLIERLEVLLVAQDMACMELLDDLSAIPGLKEVARGIEEFEFERAVLALEKYKEERRSGGK